jgi:hypothetical protein
MNELAEIRDQLAGLERSVGRIEGGIEEMRSAIRDRGARVEGLETRVRALEDHRQKSSGAVGLARWAATGITHALTAFVAAIIGAIVSGRGH